MFNQLAVVVATLISLIAAWIVYYHFKVFSFWSSRGIKGPMPWPIFGTNIYYLFSDKLVVDANWKTKYGKIYGIYEGYLPTLRLLDNQLIKHVYIKEFSSFTDRNSSAIHGENAKSWILWSKGDYWANQRAMVSPMFTSNRMRLLFTKMTTCVDNFMQEANTRINSKKSIHKQEDNQNNAMKSIEQVDTRAVFSKRDVMDLTLDVIAQCFFSIKLNPYREKANEFLRQAYGFSEMSLKWLLFWLLLPTSLAKYFQVDLIPFRKYRYFDQLSQSIIQERRRSVSSKTITESSKNIDLIQAFLEAKIPDNYESIYTEEDDNLAHYNDQIKRQELEQIQEKQVKQAKYFRCFSDGEIRGAMTFLFIAGFDTTASTIGFCLYELSHQLDVQEEIYQELIDTFGEIKMDNNSGGPKKLDYSQLFGLKKLDAFVSETLRLYSPVIENNRIVTAKEGAVLPTNPAIHLPKGTAIATNFYIIHHDPDYFERADEFDMSRFYPENRDNIKSCTYMPFSVGPRNCAGMRFALLEIKLLISNLLLKYTIAPGPNNLAYPPKFVHNFIFLQFKNTDFKLQPRD